MTTLKAIEGQAKEALEISLKEILTAVGEGAVTGGLVVTLAKCSDPECGQDHVKVGWSMNNDIDTAVFFTLLKGMIATAADRVADHEKSLQVGHVVSQLVEQAEAGQLREDGQLN